MAPGTRPKRIDIDPQGRDGGKINDLTAQLQRDFFGRMGMADRLEPAGTPSSNAGKSSSEKSVFRTNSGNPVRPSSWSRSVEVSSEIPIDPNRPFRREVKYEIQT
jgi:hypothetical protein